MLRRHRISTAIAALVVLPFAAGVAGCGSSGSSATASGNSAGGDDLGQKAHRKGELPKVQSVSAIAAAVPAEIQKSGTLTVVMSTSSPPAHFTTSKGMRGSDADLAALLAKTLGLKVKVVGVPLDQILPGLKAHRYDAVISQFSPTPERAQVLDFVNYAQSGTSLGVQSTSSVKINELCGAKVGVQKGSSQANEIVPGLSEKCQSQGQKPVAMQTYPDSSSALLALRSSRIDGVLIDSPVMGYAAKQSDGKLKVVGTIHQSPVAIGTPKGDGMVKPIQQALQHLDQTGALEKVMGAWGMDDSVIHKFTVNAIDNG